MNIFEELDIEKIKKSYKEKEDRYLEKITEKSLFVYDSLNKIRSSAFDNVLLEPIQRDIKTNIARMKKKKEEWKNEYLTILKNKMQLCIEQINSLTSKADKTFLFKTYQVIKKEIERLEKKE